MTAAEPAMPTCVRRLGAAAVAIGFWFFKLMFFFVVVNLFVTVLQLMALGDEIRLIPENCEQRWNRGTKMYVLYYDV